MNHTSPRLSNKRLASFLVFSGILAIIVLHACSQSEWEPPKPANGQLELSAARAYFENNATDLRSPLFSENTKSIDLGEILVPQWQKALYHCNHIAQTFDIPIKTSSYLGGVIIEKSGLESKPSLRPVKLSMRLVIQKSIKGEQMRQFVATILGASDSFSHTGQTQDGLTYYADRSAFTGYMIISDLEGNPQTIFKYDNGTRTECGFHSKKVSDNDSDYTGFTFIVSQARTKTYGNGERGVCTKCGFQGIVYIEYGLCLKCLESVLLEDVTITGDKNCQKCQQSPCVCEESDRLPCGCLKGHCTCNPTNPFACDKCGKTNCNGECGNTGSGGGSSSGGQTGSKVTASTITTGHITAIVSNTVNSPKISASLNELLNEGKLSFRALFVDAVNQGIQINLASTADINVPIAFSNHSLRDALDGKSPYDIHLRSDLAQLPGTAQTVILLHEFFHVYIYGQLSLAEGVITNLATHNLNLLGLLNMAGLNVGAHEYFAKYMLADIKDILSSVLGNELDLDKIKWGGLTETTEFKALDEEKQKEIIEYLREHHLYYEEK